MPKTNDTAIQSWKMIIANRCCDGHISSAASKGHTMITTITKSRATDPNSMCSFRWAVPWAILTSKCMSTRLVPRLAAGLFLFPDQPVHCFLPRLEPAEFPLGEGLQRLVEDFG